MVAVSCLLAAVTLGLIAGLSAGIVLALGSISIGLVLLVRLREIRQRWGFRGIGGLPQRRDILHHLQAALDTPGQTAAIFYIDLDRFKIINDALGREAGDAVLSLTAGRLRRFVLGRAKSGLEWMVGHHYADEFIVIGSGVLGESDKPEDVAADLVAAFEEPFIVQGRALFSSICVGVAIEHGELDAAALIDRADLAMHRVKRDPRRNFCVFSPELHAQVRQRLDIEHELHFASERGELYLEYQPIVDLETLQLRGCEALMRWKSPRRGRVRPDEFIPIAESTGAIHSMGRWVIFEACRALRHIREVRNDPTLTMSINVSRHQLLRPDLFLQVRTALETTGLPASAIHLEITESVLMSDFDVGRRALDELKTLGVNLDVDDFGVGYSSLACLHEFPLDRIKLDRSFTRTLLGRPDAIAVVHAVVNLARNLDVEVLAEGISDPELVTAFLALDCQLAQGFYFGRPMSEQAMGEFIVAAPDVATSPL